MVNAPWLEGLNQAQKDAVTAPEGHLLINAAAGTGKTTTIASRILHLQIDREIPHDEIVAISFSRTARTQLTNKLESLISRYRQGSSVATFTFHGLAYRVLRIAIEQKETWLKPGFSLTTGQHSLFQEHAKSLVGNLSDDFDHVKRVELYSKALDWIRQGHPELKRPFFTPEDLPKNQSIRIPIDFSYKVTVSTDMVRTVWKRYNTLLKKLNHIDYAGLITEAILALQHPNGQTRKRVCEGLRYLIVDEYQDTSRAQEQLMLEIAGQDVFLNVVGDDDQAIYTFNGSDISNILNFSERARSTGLPVLPPIDLTENYRSSQKILETANRVLRKTKGEKQKVLQPALSTLPEPFQGFRDSNYDVVRVHAPKLELAARYTATEIHKLITEHNVSPSDIAVLIRKDTEHAPQGGLVREVLESMGFATIEKVDLSRTALVLETTQELCQAHYTDDLDELLCDVESGNCDSELGEASREEVAELLREALALGAEQALEAYEYLYEIEQPDAEQSAKSGSIDVRTVHSAKGLEFRIVFLLYIAERSFPNNARPDIEEERRLYYVGLTRAQERLYVIGTPASQTKTDFFSEIGGVGVIDRSYTVVPIEKPVEPTVKLDDVQLTQIEHARKQLMEKEAKEKNDLKRLFEEDDF